MKLKREREKEEVYIYKFEIGEYMICVRTSFFLSKAISEFFHSEYLAGATGCKVCQ